MYRPRSFGIDRAGEPLSDWADVQSDDAYDGCGIKPLTLDEAEEWGEKHLSGDEYVAAFGRVEE